MSGVETDGMEPGRLSRGGTTWTGTDGVSGPTRLSAVPPSAPSFLPSPPSVSLPGEYGTIVAEEERRWGISHSSLLRVG